MAKREAAYYFRFVTSRSIPHPEKRAQRLLTMRITGAGLPAAKGRHQRFRGGRVPVLKWSLISVMSAEASADIETWRG
jgi:hypothetical protein